MGVQTLLKALIKSPEKAKPKKKQHQKEKSESSCPPPQPPGNMLLVSRRGREKGGGEKPGRFPFHLPMWAAPSPHMAPRTTGVGERPAPLAKPSRERQGTVVAGDGSRLPIPGNQHYHG